MYAVIHELRPFIGTAYAAHASRSIAIAMLRSYRRAYQLASARRLRPCRVLKQPSRPLSGDAFPAGAPAIALVVIVAALRRDGNIAACSGGRVGFVHALLKA